MIVTRDLWLFLAFVGVAFAAYVLWVQERLGKTRIALAVLAVLCLVGAVALHGSAAILTAPLGSMSHP